MQFIFILAVVFLSAALSDAVGLEGIFGAFMSGFDIESICAKGVSIDEPYRVYG